MKLTNQAKQFLEDMIKQLYRDQRVNKTFFPKIKTSSSKSYYYYYSNKTNTVYINEMLLEVIAKEDQKKLLEELIKSVLPDFICRQRVNPILSVSIKQEVAELEKIENLVKCNQSQNEYIENIPNMDLQSDYLNKEEINYFKKHLQIALQYMRDHNIPHQYYIPLKLRKNLGRNIYGRAGNNWLAISVQYIRCCYMMHEDVELENTIIHEYLHTAFPNDDHAGRWKSWADKISKWGDYSIQQYANVNQAFIIKMDELSRRRIVQ